MKKRYIIGGVIIVIFIAIGGYSFLNSSVEYSTFAKAEKSGRKVQVTGKWVKDKPTDYDSKANTFSFYIADEDNRVEKVVLRGPKPNNFDIATSVVVRGTFDSGAFQASDVLTKCPSKYEAMEGQHPDSVKAQ